MNSQTQAFIDELNLVVGALVRVRDRVVALEGLSDVLPQAAVNLARAKLDSQLAALKLAVTSLPAAPDTKAA